ncbi:MAG: deoxyribonuclease [Thermoprotei archaeon]|nr:MAG: deoxyribonuclease [Thermoprotei archaeon]RLF17424.1 MAG: deoxyribonuclease [Thermoprotei archaeon]
MYGRREPRYARKPVSLGGEYDVEITEVSRRGDGLARVQGFVVFVPGARPGQRIKVRVTKMGNRYAVAEMVR